MGELSHGCHRIRTSIGTGPKTTQHNPSGPITRFNQFRVFYKKGEWESYHMVATGYERALGQDPRPHSTIQADRLHGSINFEFSIKRGNGRVITWLPLDTNEHWDRTQDHTAQFKRTHYTVQSISSFL